MTPAALLILKICAAHVTMVPVQTSNQFIPAYIGNGLSLLQQEYAKYDPGFEHCGLVVPDLQREQQEEIDKAAGDKYMAAHADEIKALIKALQQLGKEQPNAPFAKNAVNATN